MIWRPAASSRVSNASEDTFAGPCSAYSLTITNWKASAKWGTIVLKSRDGSNSSPRYDYTLEYHKGSANGNADLQSLLPEPATEHDRSGSTSLNRLEDGGIYLRRSCGLNTPSSSIPGVVLGGLVPRTERAVLGGLPFTSVDFRVCRTHGPRVRTFMLFREVSSLVFLPPSPPSIAVPVTGGLCLQPKTLSLRF